MNETTQIIEEDDNDNRRATTTNLENNRVALQCAVQYMIALKSHTMNPDYYTEESIINRAEKFKKWLNEA